MIVTMKKVSIIMQLKGKEQSLLKLRKLGLMHIEEKQCSSIELSTLKEKLTIVESGVFTLSDKKYEKVEKVDSSQLDQLEMAKKVLSLTQNIKECNNKISYLNTELDRLKGWGDINLENINNLSQKGVKLVLLEAPINNYYEISKEFNTIILSSHKKIVRFVIPLLNETEYDNSLFKDFVVKLPEQSTCNIEKEIDSLKNTIKCMEEELTSYAKFVNCLKQKAVDIQKQIEFETYYTSMEEEVLSKDKNVAISFIEGFIQESDLPELKKEASLNSWGLIAVDPTVEDNVPTKLKNNKFVSLIYPLTDFLGTVPGYFEYDISSWFLGFILIFFGIIFGDGGYGLIISLVSLLLILKSVTSKKKVSPAFILILLLGLATICWGTITCTWFGIPAKNLPTFLQKLSIPFISNVFEDKIWYLPWNSEFGLTTPQNVQIFCFTLALVQLCVAHIKGMIRNIKSLKMLGDLGSIMQLVGMYYIVLSLVVNPQVFSLSLNINGFPVGTTAIAVIAVGFVLNFLFANYEGSVIKSLLASLKNIVSVLLGVVNVFSDIVSYIRLWAVGLAGAAISATVNELAGPLFGNFMFIIIAIVLLVFGHGLNMILNILSVIVHGVRLNTLEFSSHLDMSWSGIKFKPFKE